MVQEVLQPSAELSSHLECMKVIGISNISHLAWRKEHVSHLIWMYQCVMKDMDLCYISPTAKAQAFLKISRVLITIWYIGLASLC